MAWQGRAGHGALTFPWRRFGGEWALHRPGRAGAGWPSRPVRMAWRRVASLPLHGSASPRLALRSAAPRHASRASAARHPPLIFSESSPWRGVAWRGVA